MAARLTIGEVARQASVAATTLRYYEQIGLVPEPARLGGQRRYDDSILARLEVIALCKSAGFSLEQIQLLFADDAPGRPASRALAEAKLVEIDAQMESLGRARAVIEWGMRCTCPSIDACTCGIHPTQTAKEPMLCDVSRLPGVGRTLTKGSVDAAGGRK